MSEKWHRSEIHTAISDESQGSIAKHLRCDELLYYTFIIHSAGERIFTIGEHLTKLQAKWLTVSYSLFALHFWIILEQETVSGSGISWAICKSAPHSRQITTPAPHRSVFTGRMPFLPPNQQRQSTEGSKQNWYKKDENAQITK